MKPQSFVRVATLSDLAGAGPFAVSAQGLDLVVARGASGWRAFDGRCPHQGALLSEGEIEGGALVCRNHRWRFSINSGRREGGPECLASYPAVERDGALYLDLSSVKPAESVAPVRSLDDLPGPRPLPVLGNAHQLGRDVHLALERWAAQYGPTFQFRIGPQRVVATTDPAVIAEVLRERPQTVPPMDRRWTG